MLEIPGTTPIPKSISNHHTYHFSYSVAAALFNHNHRPIFQGRQCEWDNPVLLCKGQLLQSPSVCIRRRYPQLIHFCRQIHLQSCFCNQSRFRHRTVHISPAKAVRLRKVKKMYHLLATYLLGISSNWSLLRRPAIQSHFAIGTIHEILDDDCGWKKRLLQNN